jgi:hypothetical protein
MANYVRKYIKNNLSGNKSICGVKETDYLEYTIGQFNSKSDTGEGKTPDSITSVTFKGTYSAQGWSTKAKAKIYLVNSSGTVIAESAYKNFTWDDSRETFNFTITGLTVAELATLASVRIEYNGSAVPSSSNISGKAYFWADSSYPATLTINYSTRDTYTVTYNANGGSGAPAAQTKTAGTALTLSSTRPTKTSKT